MVEFLNASLKKEKQTCARRGKINSRKGQKEGRLEGEQKGRLEVARRLAEDLRLQKDADELCAYLQKIIGITYEQAQACIAAVH